MQLTANQKSVFAVLKRAEVPLSAYAVLDRLRKKGFSAPTQVYRALDRLLEQGLVHRLETINAYVACAHRVRCEHGVRAFAICDNCGHVDEFTDQDLARCLSRWIDGNAFALKHSTVELHGRCAVCAALDVQKS
ncbi:transcriptional repressor [Pseudomonas sp. LRF_L74]|uniref:transcriptional repressor n=1 Tax=Pseudomonas sp. LRF_L74 TaxID=3369422 RepID=UPI003F5EE5F4